MDPGIGGLLKRTFGDLDTLTLMRSEGARRHEAEAQTRPQETTRRVTELKNQRARVKDAFQAGSFSLRDLQKRIGAIDGEPSALERAQSRAQEPLDLDTGNFH